MRTYLFALTDAGGTVPPEVGVVRRVVDRGHRVTVLADASMGSQVERAGAALRTWTRANEEFRDWELRTPMAQARGMAEHMLIGPAAAQADDTGSAIDAVEPDLVVTSGFALGAMIAAESRGVPFDLLMRTCTCCRPTGCRRSARGSSRCEASSVARVTARPGRQRHA